MTIQEIYDGYRIPLNLQMHMLRVTSCSKLIVDHWTGPVLNVDSLYKVLLLHDMGNIVKMSEEEVLLIPDELFKQIRNSYISKFQYDDHAVSKAIAIDLGLTPYEIQLMDSKVFMKNDQTLANGSYETMIGAYCDQRVAPNSVMPLLERLNEAKLRYKNRPGSSMNNPRTEIMIRCAVKIEERIMLHTTIFPHDINNDAILPWIDAFREYRI